MHTCYTSENADSSSGSAVHSNTTTSEYQAGLSQLRTQIDELDQRLFNILKDRMLVSVKVGELKKKFNKPAVQPDRMDILTQRYKDAGSALGLNPEFAAQIFKVIHDESVRIQNEILNSNWYNSTKLFFQPIFDFQ